MAVMGSLVSKAEPVVELEAREATSCTTDTLVPSKAYYLHHLLSPTECAAFRELLEGSGEVVELGSSEESYRYCSRVASRQQVAVDSLWARLRGEMEALGLLELRGMEGSDWSAVGLNELVRVVRYHPGGRFAPHCDASFTRSVVERSWWTLNIYLNTVHREAEGATILLGEAEVAVQPEEGAALLFYQPNLLHEGSALRHGEKWLLRSDVMFRREEAPCRQEAEARRLHREAQEREVGGQGEAAWRLYAKAFRLWPPLEQDINLS